MGSCWLLYLQDSVTEGFNWGSECINDPSDKDGGRPIGVSSINALANLVFEDGMVDLAFVGNPFTWNNRCPQPHNIQECLDRGFTNGDERLLFPRLKSYFVDSMRV